MNVMAAAATATVMAIVALGIFSLPRIRSRWRLSKVDTVAAVTGSTVGVAIGIVLVYWLFWDQ